MKIPQYVKKLLSKSEYNYICGDVGYTINIYKPSIYTHVDAFNDKISRLVKWANKQIPTNELCAAKIEQLPDATRYCEQMATVTIYDPVMKELEAFIGSDYKKKPNCR